MKPVCCKPADPEYGDAIFIIYGTGASRCCLLVRQ